ncbi:uncharacterized protein LOC119080493 [Bradysia coprophila]|uniref:uncharacterized protein LOC119080493 n=1 Tax=Bradysia coprophila TaxID=38358 RepID=UPI00187D88D7|nr:uncharacterized protein LOC119080493 [Bradysia coprophila]
MRTRSTFIVSILMEVTSILTQYPTCRKFDFSDPLTLNQFGSIPSEGCGPNFSRMASRSYSGSSIIPLRSSSRYFLSTVGQPFCLKSLTTTEATTTSIFKIAYFLQGSTGLGNLFFIEVHGDNGDWHLVATIPFVANRWTVYEGQFLHSGRVRLLGATDTRNTLAIEYLHIYDPQVTDENCAPTVTTTTTTTTTTAPPKLCKWEPGQEIAIGTRCVVQHGFFVFQLDGNAVIYDVNNVPIWNTRTAGIGHTFLFETNGNLVMYSSTGTDVWNSATSNMSASLLVFQEDRNLVIYNTANTSAVALWNTRTFVPGSK